ncbi:hypothetical protein GFD17_07930 [Bifidobacterium sp. SMB2]|uniref:Acetyl-CoA carboxylase n=1 Tax=Bifidobacterium saimiriisciurei TaxID=2661627 RepID=A0ABX0CB53_9BIFI|nr:MULTISPECIES: beta-L-arabinofuranosidase domain-containing protein [Bifidobacterium]NEG96679.1 hypothetical protein [Bifidobacterium sp. SMB2]NEH11835.1 hypothetical protein [Bifidobacterium saimiriisciurei]
MTDIAQSDADAITLGNLATVEFDLDLPSTGRHGSRIAWQSSDDRWLDSSGRVHRPVFGRGDRKVTLTATVTNGGDTVTRDFAVTVVQQPYTASIRSVPPVTRRCIIAADRVEPVHVRLPSWGAAITDIGAIAVPLTWPDAEAVVRPAPGRTIVTGHTGTEPPFPVTAVIDVEPEHSGSAEGPVNDAMGDNDNDNDDFPAVKPTLRNIPLAAIRFDSHSTIGRNQLLRLEYLRSVDDDRLLYAFRQAAGLDTRGARPMTGWDSPDCLLRGHTTGHVLSAYALCVQATGDDKIRRKLDYLVDALAEVQRAFARRPGCRPGFLSAYDERQFDDLERLVPYPDVWAPYYTLHKLLAGLIDAHEAGAARALPVAKGIGRWVADRLERLTPEHRQRMWGTYIAGEFGGMNEALARLATIVGERGGSGDNDDGNRHDGHYGAKRFLTAARYFDNDRLLEPLRQRVDALDGMHANQHIPQVIGHLALADAAADRQTAAIYLQAAQRFWHEVVSSHLYAVGGTGQGEMFRTPNVIAGLLADDTAETCATYNLLKLAAGLRRHGTTLSPEYGDYIELALCNHIAASIDRTAPNGGSTYFLPTRPAGRKSFDIDGNTCCHGTGLEVHFRAGDGAVLVDDRSDAVHIQLLESMNVDSPDDGIAMRIDAPDETPNVIHIHIDRLAAATLRVRVPWWALGRAFPDFDGHDDNGRLPTDTIVTVNGRQSDDVDYDASTHELVFPMKRPDGASITDIDIRFPIGLRLVRTPDDADMASIMWGPYVLAEHGDSPRLEPISRIPADTPYRLYFRIDDAE